MALHKVAVAAKDGQATPVAIPGGIQQHDMSGTGVGPNVPIAIPMDSAGVEIVPATAAQIAALMALIGEAQANPTALTVLDRLKSLGTFTDGIEGALATLNAQTDTLEALITTGNGSLASMASATIGATSPGTDAAQMIGAQGAAGMVPLAIVGKSSVFPFTLSASTGAQAVGTLIADTQVLTNLFRIPDGISWLHTIEIVDQDDQKKAIDFYILDANVSLGTEGSAVTISDANAVNIYGPFSIAEADYRDLGGVSVATLRNIAQPMQAATGTRDAYIAAVCNSGTPTYTAPGLKGRLGMSHD